MSLGRQRQGEGRVLGDGGQVGNLADLARAVADGRRSDCDSPPALMNTTFDWLKRHWYDSVDFVIWTGDSARHDLDPKIPRSLDEIVTLNRDLADRMRESFAKGVKIIPSIGNNDVYPHNVMPAGPSHLTSELSK